jgi:hypothetical protein
MFRRSFSKLVLVLGCSAILLALPTCTATQASLAEFAQVVTAGGVIYLITRVME